MTRTEIDAFNAGITAVAEICEASASCCPCRPTGTSRPQPRRQGRRP